MRAFLFGLLVLLSSLSAALADDFTDRVQAAAQDEANALGDCTGAAARHIETKSMTPEAIADAAFKECEAKIGAVIVALEGSPANLSEADAKDAAAGLVAGSRANLINLIMKARGE